VSIFKKYTLQCEGPKTELNMCLRQLVRIFVVQSRVRVLRRLGQRVDKAERNRADAKVRKEKFSKALEELKVDE